MHLVTQMRFDFTGTAYCLQVIDDTVSTRERRRLVKALTGNESYAQYTIAY